MPQIDIKLQTTADTSGFAKTEGASAHLSKSLGELGHRLEHMFTGRHLASAVATAVGVNIEKIADHLARFATSMSEVEEEAYKKIEALSDKAAELGIKNIRARQSGEQQLESAMRERNILQREIEESHATTAVEQEEILKKRIRLEERVAEIHALEAKNTPEIQAQADLAKQALRVQTLAADQNQTDYQKKNLEISLMRDELSLRQKLIDLTAHAKLENGETETTRAAKLQKLEAENQQLRNKLRFLQFGSGEAMDARTAHDKYLEFQEDQAGAHLNFAGAAGAGVENWIVKVGSLASQVSDTVESTLGKAVQGITDGIVGWVYGATTFGQAMSAIGSVILKTILGDIVEIGVKMLFNAVLGRALTLANAGTALATAAAVAAPMAAIWAVPATLATIATLGAAAAQAPASILAAEGVTLASAGFADGGPTGGSDPSRIAGFVHEGEWVAPQWMVRHPGFGQLIAGLEGARSGAFGGFNMGGFTSPGSTLTRPAYAQPTAQQPKIFILQDPREFARLMQENSGDWFQDMTVRHMRRNS